MEQLISELMNCTTNLSYLLPSLEKFLSEFTQTETLYNIKVISDTVGNIDIDFPGDMSDKEIMVLKERVGVLDRLINTQGTEAKLNLEKGMGLFSKIKSQNPDFKSEILNQLAKFNELNKSYKH